MAKKKTPRKKVIRRKKTTSKKTTATAAKPVNASPGKKAKDAKAREKALAAETARVEKLGAALYDDMDHAEIDAAGMDRIGEARAELVAGQLNETKAKEAYQRARDVRETKQDALNAILAEYFPLPGGEDDDPNQLTLGDALPDELPGNLGRRSLEEIPFLESAAVTAMENAGINSVQMLHTKIVGQPGDWWKPVKGVAERRANKLATQFKTWLWGELRKAK